MKLIHLTAVALLASCTALPPTQGPLPATPGKLSTAGTPQATPGRHSPAAQAKQQTDLIQSAEAKIQSDRVHDRLTMQVILGRPAGFRTQALELSRIASLRAWAKGPGIQNQIWNQGDYVGVNTTGSTNLQIQQVPRGKNRVVSVAGYELKDEAQQTIPGALLKAVYDSPADSYEITLYFTWRSTALANIIEALQAQSNDPNNPDKAQIAELLENLDKEELGDFLDALIYGNNPPPPPADGAPEGSQYAGHPYQNHPATLDPAAIAEAIIQNNGTLPNHTPGNAVDPQWLQSTASENLSGKNPEGQNFVDSTIQVQITDPASGKVNIAPGQDHINVPGVVPGTWEAIFTVSGPLGSVETRVPVVVDQNGNMTFPEGGNEADPARIPPIIKAVSESPKTDGSGNQLVLYGDGFNETASDNTITIGGVTIPSEDIEYKLENGTPTLIIKNIPADLDSDDQITVTNNGKTSNEAPYQPIKIVALSENQGAPGSSVTITVQGFTPEMGDVVLFPNGSGGTVEATVTAVSADNATITVTVPEGAATGPLTVQPSSQNNVSLQSPQYQILFPPIITSASPTAGNTVTLTGSNFTGGTVSIGGTSLDPADYEIVNDNTIILKNVTEPISEIIYVSNSQGTALALMDYEYSNVFNFVGNSNMLASLPGDVSFNKRIYQPHGITVDKDGNIYVADLGGSSTFFTSWYWWSEADSEVYYVPTARSASFSVGIHKFDADGNWVWSTGSSQISSGPHNIYSYNDYLTCGPDPLCSDTNITIPVIRQDNLFGPIGYQNGSRDNALFNSPEDVATDLDGHIYVADTANHAVRRIDKDTGMVTTIARVPGPEGLQIGPDGALYVTGNYPHNPSNLANMRFAGVLRIAKDKLNTPVTTDTFTATALSTTQEITAQIKGAEVVSGGEPLCNRTAAALESASVQTGRFCHVEGIGMDGKGHVYVADVDNFLLRKMHAQPNGSIDPAKGKVTVQADVCGTSTGACSPFAFSTAKPYIYMHEIRVDKAGHIFIPAIDSAPSSGVYKVSPDGTITLVAGNSIRNTTEGHPLTGATFFDSRGIDFGPDGSLYVVDTSRRAIRKITRVNPVSGLQMP